MRSLRARSNEDRKNRYWIVMNTKHLILAALLSGAAFSANAANNSLASCTDLGADREIVRAGSARTMALRDGDSHYLVSFRSDCGSLTTTGSLKIIGEGTEDRLCPSNTVVRTKRDECQVQSVKTISADDFASRKRRAR